MMGNCRRALRQATATAFLCVWCLVCAHGAQTRVLTNGCAPIAVFVACRSLGAPCSLEKAIEACGWREGAPVQLAAVCDALEDFGLQTRAGRLDPDGLDQSLLRGAVVMLVVGEKGPDAHLVTAVGTHNGMPVIIDYSHKPRRWDAAALAEQWDGGCVAVAPSDGGFPELPWIVVYSGQHQPLFIIAGIVGAAAGAGLIALGAVLCRRRRIHSATGGL